MLQYVSPPLLPSQSTTRHHQLSIEWTPASAQHVHLATLFTIFPTSSSQLQNALKLTALPSQINPGPLVRWQWGQNHSSSYSAAVANMTTFKNWWTSPSSFGAPNPRTCSEGIFVYASYLGTPSYRNTYFDAPTTPPLGFSTGRAAVFGGGAELVVPVGEIPYESTISLKTEYLPVAVNMLVAPGCDLVLANLVKELEETGILRPSRAGSRI
jgi:hypothetical protein